MAWYDAGGAPTPVGAWAAIGAASQAASYTDLSGNGNDLGVGVAPTWDAAAGWTFNGSTQWLNTSRVPAADLTETIIIRYSGWAATAVYQVPIGAWARAQISKASFSAQSSASQSSTFHGPPTTQKPVCTRLTVPSGRQSTTGATSAAGAFESARAVPS